MPDPLREPRVPAVLTRDERLVLQLSAAGMHVDEVAALLGMIRPLVRARLVSAIVALGAQSKLDAVVIALRCGLIEPPR